MSTYEETQCKQVKGPLTIVQSSSSYLLREVQIDKMLLCEGWLSWRCQPL